MAAALQSLTGALRRVVVLERKVSRLEKVAEDSGAIESPEEEGVVEVGSPPAPVLWEEGQCVYVDMRASVVEKEVCRAAVAGVAVAGGAGEHLCEDCVLKKTLAVQDGDQYGFDNNPGAPEYSAGDGGDETLLLPITQSQTLSRRGGSRSPCCPVCRSNPTGE
jgi:hypothetical protein